MRGKSGRQEVADVAGSGDFLVKYHHQKFAQHVLFRNKVCSNLKCTI